MSETEQHKEARLRLAQALQRMSTAAGGEDKAYEQAVAEVAAAEAALAQIEGR
jgi:hypothetical protein